MLGSRSESFSFRQVVWGAILGLSHTCTMICLLKWLLFKMLLSFDIASPFEWKGCMIILYNCLLPLNARGSLAVGAFLSFKSIFVYVWVFCCWFCDLFFSFFPSEINTGQAEVKVGSLNV